ncbi:MAG: histidine ammonia-lyase [Acidobacteriota bacterium]|nr:histidine ammonia-lyase [Blastocatellia bacterium]MDW8413757.1 histidine ammonia-lyase [Acidobacteriota bacterium]
MIVIDGNSLTVADVEAVAIHRRPVELSEAAAEQVAASRRLVEEILAEGRVSYGINTGFGKLSDVTIQQEKLRELQLNLVRSHAIGVGCPLSIEEARAMLLLRANVLAKGYSGVRVEVINTLLDMLNCDVTPVVPEKGSVGASGDLAPLAHLALVLVGEGEAFYQGERMSGKEAMRRAGIPLLVLEAKEGLSLINGTQAITAVGSLLLRRASRLAEIADLAGAMSLEALNGTPRAASPLIQKVRPYPGQKLVADNILKLTEGSQIIEAHRNCSRVQDAYSLRCIPQVHGAVRNVIAHVSEIFEIEINSATDNPLVFVETGEVLSGGNFHGEPLALGLDYLAIALTELGAISERRIERLVNPDLSGLPAFLTPQPGTCSGFMIAQVCAVALQGENKVLAHPASVDSLPTSANKEDHVSMGMTAALKLRTIVENVETILATELLVAAQALDFHKPLLPGRGVRAAYELIRSHVPFADSDVVLAPRVEKVRSLLSELYMQMQRL